MDNIIRNVLTVLICSFSSVLQADPPDRVARLSSIEGNVSFLPAGQNEWLDAVRNRPLITGDRLWNDTNGFSQVQLGGAKLCVGPNTNVNVLNLDNNIAQFQLTEGSINLEVNSLKNNQSYEIDTPNVAFSVQKPGSYRIDVDKSGDATIVQIAKGQGEAYGDKSSYIINHEQAYRFTGTDLDYDAQFQGLPEDELNKWCNENKNAPKMATTTTRYVSQDVIGYEDLEYAGTWETVEEYGPVWSPNNVDPDWAPYSSGHWAWIEPWGWNWIGQEDWGFAPYHYGRWVHSNKWYWVPYGDEGAVYAPALVAFIGAVAGYALASQWGDNVGWFPLGPGDIYRPPYSVSYNYFLNINRGDRINQRLLGQAYRNPNMQFNYRNRNVANAITAVPQSAFVQSQNVNKARVRVNANQLDKLPASSNLALKPQKGTANGAQPSRFKPSDNALSRQALTKARVPSNNQAAIAPKVREVKPSKPRDISQSNNRVDPALQNNRPSRDDNKPRPKRSQDERFNQPLPKRQQDRPNQNDSNVPERFRQTMPEYDPSGGRQLRPKPSDEQVTRPSRDRREDRRPETNQQLDRQKRQLDRQIQRQQGGQPNQDLRTQQHLERQQQQQNIERQHQRIERQQQRFQDQQQQQNVERQQQRIERQQQRFQDQQQQIPRSERHRPEFAPQQQQPQIRERAQQMRPEVRQHIQENAPQIRQQIEQRVQPQIQQRQIQQQIQRQAPPAPPPVQQIQRPAVPPAQAAPPGTPPGQWDKERRGRQ